MNLLLRGWDFAPFFLNYGSVEYFHNLLITAPKRIEQDLNSYLWLPRCFDSCLVILRINYILEINNFIFSIFFRSCQGHCETSVLQLVSATNY